MNQTAQSIAHVVTSGLCIGCGPVRDSHGWTRLHGIDTLR